MLDVNLKQLETFVLTVELGSFTKAAEELYLTQSTVSTHIQALERAVGAPLLVRSGKRHLQLTPEGENILPHVKDILSRCQILQEAIGQAQRVLTLGASTVPGHYVFPKLMSKFLASNPSCQYQLRQGDSKEVHQLLDRREISIGCVGVALDPQKYHYTPLMEDKLVLVTPNTSYFQEKKALHYTGRDLFKEPLILREDGSGTRRALEDFFRESGLSFQHCNIVAQIDNPESVKQAVLEGLGVSVLSHLAVAEQVEAGKMLSFELQKDGVFRTLYLATLQHGKLPQLEQDFLAFAIKNT